MIQFFKKACYQAKIKILFFNLSQSFLKQLLTKLQIHNMILNHSKQIYTIYKKIMIKLKIKLQFMMNKVNNYKKKLIKLDQPMYFQIYFFIIKYILSS